MATTSFKVCAGLGEATAAAAGTAAAMVVVVVARASSQGGIAVAPRSVLTAMTIVPGPGYAGHSDIETGSLATFETYTLAARQLTLQLA